MRIIAIFFGVLITFSVFCQNTYEDGLEYCTINMTLFKKERHKGKNMGPICMIGHQLPKMKAFTTISGKIVTDVYFENKVTVINFWFEGCPPCEAEIPGLNDLVNQYGNRVNFLAIGRNNKEDIIDFLKDHPWKFDHLSSESLIDEVYKLRWGFPTTFVVDRNKIIRAAFSGGRADNLASKDIQDRLQPIIDSLLKN